MGFTLDLSARSISPEPFERFHWTLLKCSSQWVGVQNLWPNYAKSRLHFKVIEFCGGGFGCPSDCCFFFNLKSLWCLRCVYSAHNLFTHFVFILIYVKIISHIYAAYMEINSKYLYKLRKFAVTQISLLSLIKYKLFKESIFNVSIGFISTYTHSSDLIMTSLKLDFIFIYA